jgi:hypothetical protein
LIKRFTIFKYNNNHKLSQLKELISKGVEIHKEVA